jgi:SecD/SecF fusion protein
MKSLFGRILLGVLAVAILGAFGAGLWKWYRIATRPSMEKLGGTVLVYELDLDKLPDGRLPPDYQPQEMADALKRRLDPSDLLGIEVQPVEANRVEVRIPGASLTSERRSLRVSSEEVEHVKDLVRQIGVLEFRILANEQDDKEAIAAARAYFAAINDPNEPEDKQRERQSAEYRRAERGLPPHGPSTADGKTEFRWSNVWGSGEARYSWIRLNWTESWRLGLDGVSETDPQLKQDYHEIAKARDQGTIVIVPTVGQTVLFSRRCQDHRLTAEQRRRQPHDYFFLTRDPRPADRLTSKYLVKFAAVADDNQQPAVDFRLTTAGGDLFHALTSQNKPSGDADQRFSRTLAISVDDTIFTAWQLRGAMRAEGRITGNFTQDDVERLVLILRAGALPATLKPLPVSEMVVEPTRK